MSIDWAYYQKADCSQLNCPNGSNKTQTDAMRVNDAHSMY